MNRARFLIPLLCSLSLALTALAESPKEKSTDVTAAQVNGTWKSGKNTFKVWALGGGKLQLSFDGVYEYKSPAGPMANTGEASGIGKIEGDTAVFHPDGAEETDKITLQFTGGKLVVKQEGTCGFGNHVFADGTYRKSNGKKPKFDE
jgi:hypothetical protein